MPMFEREAISYVRATGKTAYLGRDGWWYPHFNLLQKHGQYVAQVITPDTIAQREPRMTVGIY